MRKLVLGFLLSLLTLPSAAQSVTALAPVAVQQFFTPNGVVCAGCELFTYAAGTTTKVSTYVNATGATPATNPIIMNSAGEPPGNTSSSGIWLSPGVSYKFVFAPAGSSDPPTAPYWTVDNIQGMGSAGGFTVANIAALQALPVGLIGGPVTVAAYVTAGDMPPDSYRLQNPAGSCSLAAGAGDGFSQIPSNTPNNCWLIMPESIYDVRQAGVVVGGTDPNNTNAAQINAVFNYVNSFPTSTLGSSGYPIVTCGGQLVGWDVGVLTITGGPINFESCDLESIGPNASFVAGDGSMVNRTIYTRSSGALTVPLWTPPDPYPGGDPLPVGILNVAQSANFQKVKLTNISINCNHEPNCATLVNGSAFTQLFNVNLANYVTYGMFTTGGWTWTDGNVQESSDPTQWTGYGLYCAGGRLTGTSVDSLTKGVTISLSGVNVATNSQCGDFHLNASHVWTGASGTSTFGAFSDAINMILTASGRYNISDNTFDVGATILRTDATTGSLPNAVFSNNTFESASPTNDGWLVLQCMKSSGGCGNSSNDSNPANALFGQTYPKLVTPIYFPITLEDVNGSYNPSVWSQNIQRQAGQGNTFNSYITPLNNNITQQATHTFTGNISSGNFNITNVSAFPARGTAVTDSGGCIAASTTLLDLSIDQNWIWLAGPTAPTGTCSGDTLTIGSATFTANVVSGSWQAAITSATGWLMPGVSLTDTGGCIPSSSWISGYNIHTGQLLFTNDVSAGPAPASGTCTNDTFTATPSNYYIQPEDAGNMLTISSVSQIALISNMQQGFSLFLNVRTAVGNIEFFPLGSSTVNSSISSPFFLPDGVGAVDPLIASANGAWSLYYGLNNFAKPPQSLSGFGTGAAFSATPSTTASFLINVGTSSGNTGTVTMPAAPHNWSCTASDLSSTSSTVFLTKQLSVASPQTTVKFGNFTAAGAAGAWNDNDILAVGCIAN